MLTPLELVIRDRSLGWVTLAYHPAVDLSKPIPLVLDNRRLGPVTIGWITPEHLADPHATTVPLTYQTQPLPGHESLHRAVDPGVAKAGYDATDSADQSGGEAADDGHPAVGAGSDGLAKPRTASFLEELGKSLNPISTAQAADRRRTSESLKNPRIRWPGSGLRGGII